MKKLILGTFLFFCFSGFASADALDLEQKQALSEYAYSVLDNYFEEAELENIDLQEIDFDYEKVFVTINVDGKIRGCQGGATAKEDPERIWKDIQSATTKSIEDNRFGGAVSEDEHQRAEITINFLYNKREVSSYEEAEMGIHAIEIQKGTKSAYFKESVPISSNYSQKTTFERLCKKAGLDETCYKLKTVNIYLYDTLTFHSNREGEITDLYRYNILVDLKKISQKKLYNSIKLIQSWFLNNINQDTGLLEYEYLPSADKYSEDNNHVRQLAAIWAMAEVDNFLDENALDELVQNSLDYYLGFRVDDHLSVDRKSPIAYNAFLVMALVNYPEYENADSLAKEFAEGILSLQKQDGSFNTYFGSDSDSGIDFYPGEAMLALMYMYEHTGDTKYLKAVKEAFPYYREYWLNNKNTAFIPWHSRAYYKLYQATKDPELADFVFEMNDWLIDNYQVYRSEYADEIGGFPKDGPKISTTTYLEGINDAYSMAVLIGDRGHKIKYRRSLMKGVRFILQLQITEENSFYLENPERAIGGIKRSLKENYVRCDNVQHASFALMKLYQNEIFN